jgi:hypothetical protein
MQAVQTVKKTSANMIGSMIPVEAGHGSSPKTKIQRRPAAAPKITNERMREIKNPGIPNKIEYTFLFFIGTPDLY